MEQKRGLSRGPGWSKGKEKILKMEFSSNRGNNGSNKTYVLICVTEQTKISHCQNSERCQVEKEEQLRRT